MNLYFFTEARLDRVNGDIWTSQGFSMILWQRYLVKFDHVYIMARVQHISEPSGDNLYKLDDSRVTVIDLPYYVGFNQYLGVRRKIQSIIRTFIKPGNAYICRVPGLIGSIAAFCLKRKGIPYGVEIVGDPWDALSPRGFKSRFARVFQLIGCLQLKKVVRNASSALYVTNYMLQQKYPVKDGVFTVGASNVVLKDDCYSSQPRLVSHSYGKKIKMLAIGSLEQMYKAPDVVLQALVLVKNRGYNPYLTWFGDGRYRLPMIKMAEELNLQDNVNFVGSVKQDTIREEFAKTDLFVHASRAEGLPRALVEAMAYGLPCIGSSIAGIPELLNSHALVKPDDIIGLADIMIKFITDNDFAQSEANRNWEESKKYHDTILTTRRLVFYDEIIRLS